MRICKSSAYQSVRANISDNCPLTPYRLPLLIFILALASGCASTPALHVIGVYEGKTPAGVDDLPWWGKCDDAESMRLGSPSSVCAGKYATVHQEREVIVNVSDDTRPLILAFTAYEPTHWKVVPKGKIRFTKVVLAGNYPQRVSGLPDETPVEIYKYYPTPCENCWKSGISYYDNKRPPAQLKAVTGLDVTSFQGRYRGTEFSIFPGMKQWK